MDFKDLTLTLDNIKKVFHILDDLSPPPPPPPLPVDTRSRGGLSFDSRLSLDERRARDQQHASRPLTEAVSFVPAWARPSQISTTPIASPPRDKKENKELKKQHIKQVVSVVVSCLMQVYVNWLRMIIHYDLFAVSPKGMNRPYRRGFITPMN